MSLRILVILILAMCSANAESSDVPTLAEQYVCIADQSAGFKYNRETKVWESSTFSTDTKYLVSPSTKDIRGVFQITELGGKRPVGFCKHSFNDAGYLSCDMYFGTFTINKKNGRFQRYNFVGYLSVGPDDFAKTDEESDTPFLEIGRCTGF